MPPPSVQTNELRDSTVRDALLELERRLRSRYGSRLVRLILFGSRARGDNRADSDADVAVVLCGPIHERWAEKEAILDETFPILLATGLYIQPWPIDASVLEHPERAPNPTLIREILRDGLTP